MADILFTTKECAWSNTKLTVLSRTIIGARGFEFNKEIEKEHLYAAGSDPIDIQSGNKKPDGNIKILKFELDLLNDAAQADAAGYEDITEVPHPLILITCQYKKNLTDPIRTIVATGVAFTKMAVAMEQNAKMTEVTLPFICMRINHVKS
jgi:hypothetical protein